MFTKMMMLFTAIALCSEVNATQQQGQNHPTNRKRSDGHAPRRYTPPPQQQQEIDDTNSQEEQQQQPGMDDATLAQKEDDLFANATPDQLRAIMQHSQAALQATQQKSSSAHRTANSKSHDKVKKHRPSKPKNRGVAPADVQEQSIPQHYTNNNKTPGGRPYDMSKVAPLTLDGF